MEAWLICALLGGFLGAFVGRAFGRLGMGVALGVSLGPIGALVILFIGLCGGWEGPRGGVRATGPVRVPCPRCREAIVEGASICPFCRSELTWPEKPKKVVRIGGRAVKPRRLAIRPKR